MRNLTNLVIFSLDRPDRPYNGHIDINNMSEVIGVYKNTQERSFAVPLTQLSEARQLANMYNQECILVVDNNAAFLEYIDGRTEYVGEWKEISRIEAATRDAYTIYNNKYFAAV